MKPVIYQLVVRYFGNTNLTNQKDGSIAVNGCGKFEDINTNAVRALKNFGVTHVWLTGVLRQATLTDYSAIGLPPDDPDIVKGIAGSFFAVRDYFDVSPDYATAPERRMQELEALVNRLHDAGLQVLIDFVPNHVSRGYNCTTHPTSTLGCADDMSLFFSTRNNFFYLVDPSNQSLELCKPSHWNPAGVIFDGRFAPEDGSPGHVPKATGNNVTNPRPSATDWYETIKLNYGFNFVTGESRYAPQPRTWGDMDAILAFWQAKGVDGFRCDFAHYVPQEAWQYLIGRARQRRHTYFFAEAYPFVESGDPVESQEQLIDAGFDAVYHYQSYNALKRIYTDDQVDAFDRELAGHKEKMRSHFVSYLENHDQRRIASPIVRSNYFGASGFGSAEAGYQLAPLQFLYGSGPILLLNGQEVGEPGAGDAGFSREDGRTTIFDYWAMPEFSKWVNGLRFDGGALEPSQLALRAFYGALNQLCQHPSVASNGFWGLWYFNNPARFADCPPNLFSYARFQPQSGAALLIAANLQPGVEIAGQLRLPHELVAAIGLPETTAIRMILSRSGTVDTYIGTFTRAELTSHGFRVSIENQSSQVYLAGAPVIG